MQVFRCALKIAFRNPLFLLVYTVALSFMGVAMSYGVTGDQGDSYEAAQNVAVSYAVVDRDGEAAALGIERFLQTEGEQVDVEDTSLALQDAVATGSVDYILIVPEGWGESFVQASKRGEELPKMESVYSFYSAEGALMDADLANYAGILSACVASDPDASPAQWADAALAATDARVAVSVEPSEEAGATPGFTFYLQFNIYSLFASIVVCVSMLLTKLNRTDVRRRNLTSPVSYASYTLQVIMASFVLTLVIDAWILGLGIACFSESVVQLGMTRVAQMCATVVLFSLVPLGLGCLLGQLGVGAVGMSAVAANGVGNIAGLVLSFLGGAWMPLSIVPEAVRTAARFFPGIWYTDALASSGGAQLLECWAILLLYACALFAVALTVGRFRTQTSEAGGNAAAEVAI